jgi:hypothetical protein
MLVGLQELANRSIRIFYVAFIVVGSFFILNLVIGVSIDKVMPAPVCPVTSFCWQLGPVLASSCMGCCHQKPSIIKSLRLLSMVRDVM